MVATYTDNKLVRLLKKEGCQDSLIELSNRHKNLFYKTVHKFSTQFAKHGICLEEILNDKDFVIYKSALSFNIRKKTKFSTWLANCTRYMCLNKINEVKRRQVIQSEEELNKHFETQSLDKFVNYKEKYSPEKLLKQLKEMGDERVYRVFSLRYNSGKRVTWNSVARKMRTTSQTALNLHKRGLKFLKEKVKKQDQDIYE